MLSTRRAWLTVLILAAVGCAKSKPPAPPPVAVSGKVVFAGSKPVVNMVISLHPQDEPNASNRPSGALDKDGRFKIDAAIPGRYKVTLAPIPSQAGSAGGVELPAPKKFDPKDEKGILALFRDAKSSPLEVTVPEGGGELPVLTVR